MTRTGEREICSVSGRLPDNPGELARIFPVDYWVAKPSRNHFVGFLLGCLWQTQSRSALISSFFYFFPCR